MTVREQGGTEREKEKGGVEGTGRGRGREREHAHEHFCLQEFSEGAERATLSWVFEKEQTLSFLEDTALQICENAKTAFSPSRLTNFLLSFTSDYKGPNVFEYLLAHTLEYFQLESDNHLFIDQTVPKHCSDMVLGL